MNPHRSRFLRRSRNSFALVACAVSLLLFGGCMSLDNLNQFEAEWDQKHAPGTGIQGSRVGQVIITLASYEATLRQRQIAEERARQAYQEAVRQKQEYKTRQAARQKRNRDAERQWKASPRTKPKPKPEVAKEPEPVVPTEIAVPVPAEPGQPSGKVVAHVKVSYQSATVVGNQVHVLDKKPSKQSTIQFASGSYAAYLPASSSR